MKRALIKSISRVIFICLALLFATAVSHAEADKDLANDDSHIKSSKIIEGIEPEQGSSAIETTDVWDDGTSKEDFEFFKVLLKPGYNLLITGISKTKDGFLVSARIRELPEAPDLEFFTNYWGAVTKLDMRGNVQWSKEIGEGFADHTSHSLDSALMSVVSFDDGSSVAVGTAHERLLLEQPIFLKQDDKAILDGIYNCGWVVKLNKDGFVEWDTKLSLIGMEERGPSRGLGIIMPLVHADEVIATKDGSLFIMGSLLFEKVPELVFWKVGPNGNVVWRKEIIKNKSIKATTFYPLKDGSFVVGGTIEDNMNSQAWLARVSKDGKMLWDKSIEGHGKMKITQSASGELLVAGGKDEDMWLTRITLDGKNAWKKKVSVGDGCYFAGLWAVDNGEIVAVGETCGDGSELLWAAKFTSVGEIKEVRKYLPTDKDLFLLRAISDGEEGFIALGRGEELNNEEEAGWVYRARLGFEKAGEEINKER